VDDDDGGGGSGGGDIDGVDCDDVWQQGSLSTASSQSPPPPPPWMLEMVRREVRHTGDGMSSVEDYSTSSDGSDGDTAPSSSSS